MKLTIKSRGSGAYGRLVATGLQQFKKYRLVSFPTGVFSAESFALDPSIRDFRTYFLDSGDGDLTFCAERIYSAIIIR